MQINDMQFNADLEDILDELRAQLAINHIPYLSKEPKRSGNSLQIQCPYHSNGQERNRSAGIRKSDGMFHCFACGEIHSLPEIISHCFGKTDIMFGWKWLIKNFATIQVEERENVDLDFTRGTIHNMGSKNFVTEEELDSYRYYHPYWKKRGITDEYIIELFDLGADINNNCVTFPNLDINGNCIFVARRSIEYKHFNYPKNVEKQVYGIYQLYSLSVFPNDIYITESMIDCLLLWQVGKYACALNGTGNNLQFRQLNSMPNRHFIVATDNDKAGHSAFLKLQKVLTTKLLTRVVFPKGRKDIGECSTQELINLEDRL